MTDWRDESSCKGMPAAIFFVERGESDRPAKAICATCPVKQQCLDFALESGEQHGVWGGTSERQRRRMRAKLPGFRAVKPVAECGTQAGAYRHYARHEPCCDACREARRDADRRRRYGTRAIA